MVIHKAESVIELHHIETGSWPKLRRGNGKGKGKGKRGFV